MTLTTIRASHVSARRNRIVGRGTPALPVRPFLSRDDSVGRCRDGRRRPVHLTGSRLGSSRSTFDAWTRLARSIAVVLLLASIGVAAPLQRELGKGLAYLRVQEIPADLPPNSTGRTPACVVDVRYVDADATAAADFSAWLHLRATPRSPVFVLANADTSLPLLKVLATHRRGTGIAVVGIEGGPFRPDVPVHAAPEKERLAYDALAAGADINTLLKDNPDKVRNDEASLSKDRLAEASAEAAGEGQEQEPPPIDAALQRAVHLHRALVALRKI